MGRVLVFIIAFAINAPASALAQSTDALPNDTQHYGEIADPSVWPISAIGVVTVALFSRKMYRTGRLVAPKLVLTAAHCLFNGKFTAVIGINSVGNSERRTGMACSATQFAKAIAELTQSE